MIYISSMFLIYYYSSNVWFLERLRWSGEKNDQLSDRLDRETNRKRDHQYWPQRLKRWGDLTKARGEKKIKKSEGEEGSRAFAWVVEWD
jgi:hypothetical protein